MDDGQLRTCQVIAGGLWVVVISLMTAAWIVALWGSWEVAVLLATTACCMSAVAATAQIQCMKKDLCRLIRVTGGLARPDGEVHEFSGPRR